MMARTVDELAFLRAYLDHLQQAANEYGIGEPSRSGLIRTDRPPRSSVDEERCARLADALGFDGDLFRRRVVRKPDQEEKLQRLQVSVLPRIIANLESLHTFTRKEIDLTSDHVQILRFLARQRVLTKQMDIEIAVHRCRKTVGKRLRELRSYGLVTRPMGQRTGETITDAGRQILAEL